MNPIGMFVRYGIGLATGIGGLMLVFGESSEPVWVTQAAVWALAVITHVIMWPLIVESFRMVFPPDETELDRAKRDNP